MDWNVNLNLNILTSSANKKEPGNISTRGNLTSPCKCLCSTQTICRTLCKPEVIIFTRYHEYSILRVKEWMIHLREALFVSKLSSKTTIGKTNDIMGLRFTFVLCWKCVFAVIFSSRHWFVLVLWRHAASGEACYDKTWCPSLGLSHVWDTKEEDRGVFVARPAATAEKRCLIWAATFFSSLHNIPF